MIDINQLTSLISEFRVETLCKSNTMPNYMSIVEAKPMLRKARPRNLRLSEGNVSLLPLLRVSRLCKETVVKMTTEIELC